MTLFSQKGWSKFFLCFVWLDALFAAKGDNIFSSATDPSTKKALSSLTIWSPMYCRSFASLLVVLLDVSA